LTVPVPASRRLAAGLSLVTLVAALVVAIFTVITNIVQVLLAVALILVTVVAGWTSLTNRGATRVVGAVAAIVAAIGVILSIVLKGNHGLLLVVVLALMVLSVGASRFALGRDVRTLERQPTQGLLVGPAERGVLLINGRSGGAKATRFKLAEEAAKRNIEAVTLGPGDDLPALAEQAIAGGADVVGMAGGDGSLAAVATVAMNHDVGFVCVPAGTRNHFALDLGLDRDDVVGALDAFGEARERRIDVATVGDRVFLNNVSLGVYGKIVDSPEYRDAKSQTVADLLPDLLGPGAEPFDLRFTGPDGVERSSSQIIQVSNNPYQLTRLGGFGSRPSLETGRLGIVAAHIKDAVDLARLVALENAGRIRRSPGWQEWSAHEFEVRSSATVEVGIDGESIRLEPPLEFRSLPGRLRVRIALKAPGLSPAARSSSSLLLTTRQLALTIVGRPGEDDLP
jgi:diacylglycerol kinase family enzyme